jgi:hypothetical protein
VVNIYSRNYYKHVNVVCEENVNLCNVEEGGSYSNHGVRRVKKNYPIGNIIVILTITESFEIPTRNAARVNVLFLRHRQALFDSTALQGQSELSTSFECVRRKLQNIWKGRYIGSEMLQVTGRRYGVNVAAISSNVAK